MPAMPTAQPATAEASRRGQGPVTKLFAKRVHEGGVDGITRFDALSRIIGYWIRRCRRGPCHPRAGVGGDRLLQRRLHRSAVAAGPAAAGDEAALAARRASVEQQQGGTAARRAEFTEDALALEFTHRHGEDWRVCRRLGPVAGLDRHALATRKHAEGLRPRSHRVPRSGGACDKHQAARQDRVRRARWRRSSGWRAPIDATPRRPIIWDRDPWSLNTPGGVVDLRTGMLVPHTTGRDANDQDRHGDAARRVPDLAGVPGHRHRRRRRAAGLSPARRRLLPHRRHHRARAVLPLRHRRQRQVGLRQHRLRPSSATTRPSRRWTCSWRRPANGTRPTWRACAARAWSPRSRPSRAGAGPRASSRR